METWANNPSCGFQLSTEIEREREEDYVVALSFRTSTIFLFATFVT